MSHFSTIRTLFFKVAVLGLPKAHLHVTMFLPNVNLNTLPIVIAHVIFSVQNFHFLLIILFCILNRFDSNVQVLKLKEQLSEAEKEIQRLSQIVETVPTNSTSSSPSVETMAEPFLGEFEMEGYNEAFYTPAFCYAHAMDWFNQYI